MKILIGADFVPTESNRQQFTGGNTKELLGEELENILFSADVRIFNLEFPLTDKEGKIKKHGSNFKSDPASVNTYKKLGIDIFGLANNHILDYGEGGLSQTIGILDKNGIAHVGAGKDLQKAGEPCFFECNGKRFCVYAVAEHEFSIATTVTAGANPIDHLEISDTISDLSNQCDYLIVLYHGGKEYYRYPTPALRKVCRKIVEKGADLVVCQHSHCIGCEEKYGRGTIVYGQGNFLFDCGDDEYWNSGMLVEITENGVGYIPVVKRGSAVRKADADETEKILSDFYKRSEEIKDENKFNELFSDMVNKAGKEYIPLLLGKKDKLLYRVSNRLLSGAGKRILLKKMTQKQKNAFINIMECESLREVAIRYFKNSR